MAFCLNHNDGAVKKFKERVGADQAHSIVEAVDNGLPVLIRKNGKLVASKLYADLLEASKDKYEAFDYYLMAHTQTFLNNLDWIGDKANNKNKIDENGEIKAEYVLPREENDVTIGSNVEVENKALNDVLYGVLDKLGIKVDRISDMKERTGLDDVGIADIANKLILIAKNKEDINTLPHEASHFIIEAMGPNHALYKAMSDIIEKMPEYGDAINKYKNDPAYKGKEEKIKKEAIADMLVNYLIARSKTKDDLPVRSKNILDRIIKWIYSFFNKVDNGALQRELDDIFGEVSNRVFNNSLKLDSDNLTSTEIFKKQDRIIEFLEKTINSLEHRADILERSAEVEDIIKSKAIRKRIKGIRKNIENNQYRIGIINLLNHIEARELAPMMKKLEQFKNDKSKIRYSSTEIIHMKGLVDMTEKLMTELNRVSHSTQYGEYVEATKPQIDTVISQISRLKSFNEEIFTTKIKEIIKKEARPEFNVDELLRSAQSDISQLEYLFGPLYASSDETLRLIYKMVEEIKNNVDRYAFGIGKDLLALQEDMEKAGYKDMSIFHEKDANGNRTGFLLTENNWGDYYNALDNTMAKIAKELGFNDYSEVLLEKNKPLKETSLKGEKLKIYNRIWKEFNKEYSIEIAGEKVPKPKKNQEFYKIMSIPSVAAYYDKLLDVHNEAKGKLPRKYKVGRYEYMLPQITSKLMESLKDSDVGLWTTLKEKTKESVTLLDEDLEFNRADVMLDINNKPVRLVPVHYQNIMTPTKLSKDTTSMYVALAEMAETFTERTNRIDDILLIRRAAEERQVKTRRSLKGGAESNALKALDDFVNAFVYGEQKRQTEITLPNGKKILVGKLVDKFNDYVRRNNLFMNLFTTLSGYIKASIDSKVEDIVGIYTTQESKWWAEKEFDKNIPAILASIGKKNVTNKFQLMMEYNNVFQDTNEIFSRLNLDTRLERKIGSEMFYASYELTDYRTKGKLSLAIYNNFRLVDGEFVTKKEFKEKWGDKRSWKEYADKTLYNAYEIKGNKPIVKDQYKKFVTTELENRVKNIIKHRSAIVDGRLNSLDRGAITRNAFGRSLMVHRGWMVSSIVNRFKKAGFNYSTGEYEEGYYNTMGKAIWNMMSAEGSIRAKLATWNELENWQKANVRKFLADAAFTLAVSVISMAFNMIADGDDEDEWFINFLAYQANRVLLEQKALSLLPIPAVGDFPGTFGVNEIFSILNSPAAGVNQLESLSNSFKMLFDWEEISTGPYAGMYRAEKFLIQRSLLKNIYEAQFPEDKNKYLKTQIF